MKKFKVTFMYRDGANYKYYQEVELTEEELGNLKVGDEEIPMGQYKTETEEKFFSGDSDIYEYEYDPDFDHNLLEVEDIEEIGV